MSVSPHEGATMNKSDLISHIAEATSQTKDAVAKSIDTALVTIAEALARGEEVVLTGFGSFSVTDRPARQGRNPRTGESKEIPASKAPKFKAGKKLKDAVNG
jgi:DNA-binding protein HU-beta